jgi:DNA-binding MarR family transcriptional regulator
VSEALASAGLGKHHFRVLVALDDDGPSSQADIGRAIMLDRSDLHAVLARLEADGLVERAQDPDDRRRNVVALTATGRTTLRRLQRRVVAAQDELTAPLNAAERAQLVGLLARLGA